METFIKDDEYKQLIIDSLQYLSDAGKIDVFAFVPIAIGMPNHIHLIWRINKPNGKESPQGSLLKYTAHMFKKKLRSNNIKLLNTYAVDAVNKNFEFWQWDSLAIKLFTKKVAEQKLNYIHNNPLAEYWNLAKDPCDYYYSSAQFYDNNKKIFTFLKYLWDELG